MLTYNNNNIFTGYIKQLLHEFNLPKVKCLTRGTRVFKDEIYTDGTYLLRAKVPGTFGLGELSTVTEDTFHIITNYIYGNKYLNITKNLELNSHLYDSYTHQYLGNYLRFLRDYNKLDLMSMYNCFTGDVGKNINIVGDTYSFNSEDNNYVIYLVPVKYFQKYTIAIDCDTSFEMMACIYSNNKVYLSDDKYKYLFNNTYVKVAGTKFNKPFVYKNLMSALPLTEEMNAQLYGQEQNLKLMIKLPINNTSSIVVLEGDYTSTTEYTFNVGGFSWQENNDELDHTLDWFVLDSNGNYIKVLDSETNYYDEYGDPAIVFKKGKYYYTGNLYPVNIGQDIDTDYLYWFLNNTSTSPMNDQNRVYYNYNNPIYLDPNGVYYSFVNAYKTINYEVKNTERDISYFSTRNSFPSIPTKSIRNNIFVDESTGLSYVWDIESEQYKPLSSSTEPVQVYSRKYNSRLQLLFVNDGENYPFADKLVAYLLDNVITGQDKIEDNIRRLQKTFYYRKNPQAKPNYNPKIDGIKYIGFDVFPRYAGVWSQSLRDMAYDLMYNYRHSLSSTFDTIGYVDKDIEKVLGDDISYDKTGHSISGGVR